MHAHDEKHVLSFARLRKYRNSSYPSRSLIISPRCTMLYFGACAYDFFLPDQIFGFLCLFFSSFSPRLLFPDFALSILSDSCKQSVGHGTLIDFVIGHFTTNFAPNTAPVFFSIGYTRMRLISKTDSKSMRSQAVQIA